MKKNLIGLILVASLAISFVTQYNGNKMADNLKQENIKMTEKITILEEYSSFMNKNYQNLMIESKKINDEKDKLQQQLINEKALKEKAQKAQTLSRGFSNVLYNRNTRVDVKSEITADLLNKAFARTSMKGTGQSFVDAEQKFGINAIFLASIAVLESGWGSSQFARERNNLFGYGSYDSNTNNTYYFDSKKQCIMKVAEAINRDYLQKNGQWYNGATPRGVNVKYCTGSNWSSQVVEIMNLIINKATN